MKSTRLLWTALIPLGALALTLFWLQGSAGAATPLPALTPTVEPVWTELGSAEAGFWPPYHQDLSTSPDRDSGSADMDAENDRIVVVWAEGSSTHGQNDGRVKIAWRPNSTSAWRTRVVPQQIDGFAHYQPAVAVRGQNAHVVWVRKDVEGAGTGNNRISYSRCQLDTGVCTSPVGVSPEDAAYFRLAPDIAVDVNGTPHVVWVRSIHQQVGRILYSNYTEGEWNPPEIISGGEVLPCEYSQDNPAIAVDNQHVYVVWDENVPECTAEATAGIYFRQRDGIGAPSGSGAWRPGGTPLGKQISVVPSGTQGSLSSVDGFPTLDAGGGHVYVMWERLVATQTMPLYGAVYTYSLPYRVYTGTNATTDWWPGGSARDQWAVLPFTSTSATDIADYYEGVRPSLKLVGPVPHVVWHHWTAPRPAQQNELEPQAELPDEHLIDDQHPYRVSYATYRPGTDPRNLHQAQSRWVSKTIYVMENDHILTVPDLALSSIDGGKTYHLHVALHRRGAYVPQEGSFGWDVWYTNDETFYRLYMPFLVQLHP